MQPIRQHRPRAGISRVGTSDRGAPGRAADRVIGLAALLALCAAIAPTAPRADTPELASVAPELRRFVDADDGSDSDAGSLERPWATLAHAFERIEPGHTLFLRGGTYDEGPLHIPLQGTDERWTTITAYPGESVVVNASLPDFRRGPGAAPAAWELVDGPTATYRSVATDFPDEVFVGKVHLADGRAFTLVPYHDDPGRAYGLRDLRSTVYEVSDKPRYAGPGIYNDEGQLYIRLQPLPPSALHGRPVGFDFPTDPDALDIHLTARSATFRISGSHVRISHLTIAGAKSGVEIEPGAHHVQLHDIDFEIPGGAVLMREDVSDILIEACRIHGDFPPWVAWTDMKGGGGAQSRPASYSRFKSSGGGGGFVTDLTVSGNLYENVFDGMVLEGRNIVFRDNRGSFVDDMLQLGSNSENVEIAYNRTSGPGPSHNGKGDSANPGTTYVHHNLIDATREVFWGQPDPRRMLKKSYRGWHPHKPFPAHTSGKLGEGDPWKIYHNTLIFDGTASGSGAGFQLWAERNDTGVAHEVYNNIFIEVGGGPFVRKLSITAGPQVYDGNLYWRPRGPARAPLLGDVNGRRGDSNYRSLEQFRLSADFTDSKRWYPPGWEANGREGDPALTPQLRPRPGGPAASGAVALPEDLPGPRHAYRGALAPE